MNVSLYCSPTHLKVIAGSHEGSDRVKVEDFAMFPLPEGAMINGIITDEQVMIDFLHGIGEQMNILDDSAMLVIDNNSIRSKVMDMPVVPESKILEFISRELGAFTEESSEDIFDYAVLNPKLPGGGARILAVAASRELIESYRNTFNLADYSLKSINTGVNAVIKLANVSAQLREGAKILASVDERNLMLTLFEKGEYKITNKYRLFNMENTAEWRQELGNNISSVIQFHKGQRPEEEISAAFFSGLSAAQTAALSEELSFLGIEIGMFDLTSHIKLAGNASQKEADFVAGKYLLNLGVLLKK